MYTLLYVSKSNSDSYVLIFKRVYIYILIVMLHDCCIGYVTLGFSTVWVR